jgi:UDP-3-O-acyl-N-acetylglucosamine deacetylase
MAALSGLCVDNITVEMDNVEVAGLDGSAKEFVEVIEHAGLEEQDAPRRYIEIEKPMICQAKGASIQVLPDEKSRVEYFMDYDHPLLREQWVDIALGGSDGEIAHFAGEAAPARTFHVDSVKRPFALRFLAGLGRGANYDVTLVIRKDGPVNNRFRFPDEPARHKLLDLIGDLYILGCHIKGRVIARKSGHALNSCFLKKIQDEVETQARKKERSSDRRRINTESIASPISVPAGR